MGTGAIGHVKLPMLPRGWIDGAHFLKKRCRWGWSHMIRRLAPPMAATHHNHYICHASYHISMIGQPPAPTLHTNLLLAHAGPNKIGKCRAMEQCRRQHQ